MVKKTAKQSREDMLSKKKERERARRQKVKNNPDEYEKQRQKEKERYQRRKSEGKIKLIGDLSDRDKRKKRKTWVHHNRTYREKRKKLTNIENEVLCNTPTPSLVDINEDQIAENALPQTEINLRRKISRLKMRAQREKLRQKQEIERLKNENRRLRSRALKEKIAAQYRSPTKECPLPDLTPNTKIDVTLENAGVVVPNSIKKELVFGERVKQQLNANFKSIKGHSSKQVFAQVVGGSILKKYGVTCKLNMSQYLSTSLSDRKKKRANVKVNSVRRDVIQFFQNDDNSRLCAGKKECITYRKVKKQKRYMNYSLKSLHKKYLKEKGGKISYTTFCRLRPFWVVPPKVGSRDTCLCITHENFRLIVSRLHSEKIINLKTPEEVISAVMCTPHNEDCLSRQCKTCKEIQVPINEFNANSQCQYQKWCTKKESRVSSKTGKTIIVQITLKEDIIISHYNLVQEVFLLLPKYMLHVRNIYHQHKTISTIKKSLTESEMLVHIDFSENYSCKYSSEAQSVHFGASRQQISLHTGVAYTKDRVNSFCTLSASLRHDAKAIAAHLLPILERFSTPLIDTIYFLSDSPSTQYRNKTMFNIIGYYLPIKFRNINKISWSYSEAGHGKGAPDGIGATLKRTADRLVAENTDIPCYEKFVKVVNDNVSNIHINTVTDLDIQNVDNEIHESFDTFKGTMLVHNVTWCREQEELHFNTLTCLSCDIGKSCTHYDLGHIKLHTNPLEHQDIEGPIADPLEHQDIEGPIADPLEHQDIEGPIPDDKLLSTSNKPEPDNPEEDKENQLIIKPNEWVAVLFNDFWYPGVVTSVKRKCLKIQFMDREGEQFFWPKKRDIQFIPCTEILYKLSKTPVQSSARLFVVPESKIIDELI